MTENPISNRRDVLLIVMSGLLAAIFGVLALRLNAGATYPGQFSEILSRYAAHLHSGDGFVFNAGERVLLLPSVAYILLRAVLSANVIFIAALAISAASLVVIARAGGLSNREAAFAAVIGTLAWPAWMGIATPYPLVA